MTGSEAAVAERRGAPAWTLRLRSLRDWGIVVAFVALFIVLSLSSDAFLTERNLLNILDQWAPVAIMGLGLMVVLLAGGFDLSLGAIYALAGVTAAQIANGVSPEVGLMAGVVAGLGLGLLNGVFITVARVNDFVLTIGSSIVYRGLATVITGGFLVSVSAGGFRSLGGTKLPVFILAAAVVVFWFVLNRMTFGRYLRAVGGNAEAARLSGVRVARVRAAAYGISGLCAGLAGVIVVSRSGTANVQAATGIEFDVFAAVLLGGNSFGGGVGGVLRTLVGVGLLALLRNGFTLLGIDPLYQQLVTGAIFVTAITVDAFVRRATANTA
jgi:ribose transport system permease protein